MARKHLNLIPRELRPKLEIPHEILPGFFVVLALMYAVMGPVRISFLTKANRKELAELVATQEDLSKKVKSLTDETKVASRTSENFKAIEKVLGRKNHWSEIFKEMSMLIPDGVWLTSFTHRGAKGEVLSSEQLRVRGESMSQMGMVKFLAILEKSHYFSGARLISSERMKDVKPSKFQFEFTIPVKAGTGGRG